MDMDMEDFFRNLMAEITEAAKNNREFNLHLERNKVQEIAKMYNELQWIEIY